MQNNTKSLFGSTLSARYYGQTRALLLEIIESVAMNPKTAMPFKDLWHCLIYYY